MGATYIYLAAVLLCFAANSILSRLALASGSIDAASFTSVRLISGAVMLAVVLALRVMRGGDFRPAGAVDPIAALTLFLYAIFFSFAYVSLGAASGALLVFAAVQLTMIGVALYRGERPSASVWAGAMLAAGGLVYLLVPGVNAPPPLPALSMIVAGISWGVYSLRGAGKTDPVAATAWNFFLAAPLALLFSFTTASSAHITAAGAGWAIISGAFTSGLGYVMWYHVLPRFSATTAALVQLTVPALAALGGVWLLAEPFSPRLAIASIAILGGATLVIAAHRRA